MSRSITLDSGKFSSQTSALRKTLEARRDGLRATIQDALRHTGAETAEDLSLFTFPSAGAIGLAVAAMRHDVSLVYTTAGKVYDILKKTSPGLAAKFYATYKRGDLSAAARIVSASGSPIAGIIIGQPLRPELRQNARGKNGRVMAAYPLQLVTQPEIQAHLKTAIAEIGKTSAGWSACAEQLGGDGNEISWKGTAVHGSAAGEIQWIEDAAGVHLVLKNNSPLARKLISPGQVGRIMRDARARLAARLLQSSKTS